MAFKRGDKVYWNYACNSKVPNYWTGVVMEDETPGMDVTVRHDGYAYNAPYVPGAGNYHTHRADALALMPAGMKLSTAENLFTKDDALKNSFLPDATANSSGPLVNDHICHCCGNNRLSKSEKSCWLCGVPVKVTHS